MVARIKRVERITAYKHALVNIMDLIIIFTFKKFGPNRKVRTHGKVQRMRFSRMVL